MDLSSWHRFDNTNGRRLRVVWSLKKMMPTEFGKRAYHLAWFNLVFVWDTYLLGWVGVLHGKDSKLSQDRSLWIPGATFSAVKGIINGLELKVMSKLWCKYVCERLFICIAIRTSLDGQRVFITVQCFHEQNIWCGCERCFRQPVFLGFCSGCFWWLNFLD